MRRLVGLVQFRSVTSLPDTCRKSPALLVLNPADRFKSFELSSITYHRSGRRCNIDDVDEVGIECVCVYRALDTKKR